MSNGCGKQEAICHVLLHVLCRDLLSLSLSFHTCRIALCVTVKFRWDNIGNCGGLTSSQGDTAMQTLQHFPQPSLGWPWGRLHPASSVLFPDGWPEASWD